MPPLTARAERERNRRKWEATPQEQKDRHNENRRMKRHAEVVIRYLPEVLAYAKKTGMQRGPLQRLEELLEQLHDASEVIGKTRGPWVPADVVLPNEEEAMFAEEAPGRGRSAPWGRTHGCSSRAFRDLLTSPAFRQAVGLPAVGRRSERVQDMQQGVQQGAEADAAATACMVTRWAEESSAGVLMRSCLEHVPGIQQLLLSDTLLGEGEQSLSSLPPLWQEQVLTGLLRWHHATIGWQQCQYCNQHHAHHSVHSSCSLDVGSAELQRTAEKLLQDQPSILADYQAAVARQKRHLLFEMFAGAALCSKYACNHGLFYAVSLDIETPSTMQLDVRDGTALWHASNLMRLFVAEGTLVSAIVAVPCEQYSVNHTVGFRDLPGANAVAAAGLKCISRWCSNMIIENPFDSLMFVQSTVVPLLPLEGEVYGKADYCMYGYPVRKRTRLVCSNEELLQVMQPWLKHCDCDCRPLARHTCGHSLCDCLQRHGKHMLDWDQFRLGRKLNFDLRSMYPYQLATRMVDALFVQSERQVAVLHMISSQ